MIDSDFLSRESLSKTSRLSNITKIPFAFKLEPSLNLTPTHYFELRFPIFIINGYDRKANASRPWTSCLFLRYFTTDNRFELFCVPVILLVIKVKQLVLFIMLYQNL